jgi:hypothetical protein
MSSYFLCWTLIDPLQWKRQYINDDVTNSYGSCRAGNASNAFAGLLIVVDGAALLAALILAYKARNPEDEFTESKWIGLACASWIQAILIGVPIVLLTRTQPVAQVSSHDALIHLIFIIHQPDRLFYSEQYFTSTTLIFLICLSMLSLFFVPKMKMAVKPPAVPQLLYPSTGNQNLTSAHKSQSPPVYEHKNSSEREPDKDMMLVKKDEQIKQLERIISELERSAKC